MRFFTLPITTVLLASLVADCSRRSSAKPNPRITDLGIVIVSNGIQSHEYLGDGRICFVSPTVFTNGLVELGISIQDTNSGRVILTVGIETILGKYVEIGNGEAGVGLTPQTHDGL
jgi:hypothetical protein